MKGKNFIKKIRVLAEADIQLGNRDKLEEYKQRLIEKEDYESCEGIQQALNQSGGGYELRETYCNKCSKVTPHRRYDNPEWIEDKNYLFCDVCNKKQLRPEIAEDMERLKQIMETE